MHLMLFVAYWRFWDWFLTTFARSYAVYSPGNSHHSWADSVPFWRLALLRRSLALFLVVSLHPGSCIGSCHLRSSGYQGWLLLAEAPCVRLLASHLFILLHIFTFGKYGTPQARIVHETIIAWFRTIHDFLINGDHTDVVIAWAKVHATIKVARKDATYSIAGTRGLMSNVISILFNLGWQPTTYNMWEDAVTGPWALTNANASVAPHIVIRKLIDTAHRNRLYTDAHLHHNGGGLKNGVDWDCTLSYHRTLKKPELYNQKCALETIMCAATWSNARVHDIHPEVQDVCQRCGAANDTDFHTFWQCPANENIESEAVSKTQHLACFASSAYLSEPCLWLRGILPSHHTHIEPEFFPEDELK